MEILRCDNRVIDRSLRLFWMDWLLLAGMVGQALGITSMGRLAVVALPPVAGD
jgi:hypothetical protein